MLPHTHTMPHTHTWHVNKSAAFAVSRSSAWLGFALMLCCILYGVLGTLRVCQLPVASNRFVCIPFCLSASPPFPVLHSFILPCARITHSRVSICTKNSHVDCRLVHFDVIVRLISSLSSVWQSNCLTASLFLFLSSFLCSAAYFCISITWFAAFAAQTADNCAPDGMRIWLTCEPVRV